MQFYHRCRRYIKRQVVEMILETLSDVLWGDDVDAAHGPTLVWARLDGNVDIDYLRIFKFLVWKLSGK